MRKVIDNNLEDFVLLFLEKSITEKNLTKPTIDCYKKDLNGFNNFLKKNNYNLFSCTYYNIVSWIDLLNKQSLEQSTISRKISTIRQFFIGFEIKFVGLFISLPFLFHHKNSHYV